MAIRETLTLTCDDCGAMARRHLADDEHQALVLPDWWNQLEARGWVVREQRDLCPACAPVPLTTAEEIRA